MLIVGMDTETTGLSTTDDQIIEIAAVLWDTERRCPLLMYSNMLDGAHIPEELDPKITEITGITDADLRKYGKHAPEVFGEFNEVAEQGEAIMAHNGNLFDKPMYLNNCKRLSLTPVEKPWIDSSCDVLYPENCTTRRLKHLAAEHGFLNPFAHRALFDVLTMLKVVQDYDWEQIMRYAKSPTLTIVAETNFHQKELAKKQNYRWNGEQKVWTKSVKDFQLEETKAAAKAAGFAIRIVAQEG